MDLSDEIFKGLQTTVKGLNDEQFITLVTLSFDILLKRKDETAVDNAFKQLDQLIVKQSYCSFVSLILECGKNNADSMSLRNILDENKVSQKRADAFCSLYDNNKDALIDLLSTTGFNFPSLVDVDWRLDFNMKSNSVEKTNRPVYYLSFKTVKTRDAEKPQEPLYESIDFNCSVEEMLDLTNKLRDAVKQFERMSS